MLVVFGASRLFFFVAGTLAAVLLPWAAPAGTVLEQPGFLDYWAHWDGAWYTQIATEGYGARDPESTAFFPLFPLLVGVGSALGGGPALWGVLVSTFASLFATYFVYRISEKHFSVAVARAATLCFAFFPTAFFMGAPYTEALFVALSAGSYWAAYVRRDLLLAAILAALAAATRNLGVLLLIPLAYEWMRHREEFGWRGLISLGLVPTGVVGYMAYLWARFGDPLIFAYQQSAFWGRELTDPGETLARAWASAGNGMRYVLDPATLLLGRDPMASLSASNTLNLVFFFLFLVLMGIGISVLPPGLSAYTFIVTLLPVLTPTPAFPLMSMPRFLLGSFPLFLVLGFVLSKNRPALWVWLVASAGLGAVLTAMFTTWRWVA